MKFNMFNHYIREPIASEEKVIRNIISEQFDNRYKEQFKVFKCKNVRESDFNLFYF